MFERIDLDRHGLIEASAGTGKTHTIERLVLRLLAEKELLLENICVVTFTEAGAMELRARIRGLLEQACAGRTIENYAVPKETAARLREALLAFDRAGIFTIHGFCNRALSRWPVETGLARGTGIADERFLADTLVAEEMRSTWGQWDSALHGGLTKAIERSGLEAFRKQVCAIAGRYVPGLVELWPQPSDSVGSFLASEQDFQERRESVAAELRAEARGLLDGYRSIRSLVKPSEIKDRKFEAITAWLEACSGGLAAIDTPVAEEEAEKDTARKWFGFTAPDLLQPPVGAFYGRWTLFIEKKTRIAGESAVREKTLVTSLAASLRRRVDSYRIGNGMVSYGDMIRAVERALAQEDSALLSRLRNEYRYGIIDEFQDTNALQWNIFRRIFMESGDNRLFVVGDSKQSIFRVQDADVFTYLEAKRYYEEQRRQGRAEVYTLGVNYRSSPGLVAACNALFSPDRWFKVPGIEFTEAIPDTNAARRKTDVEDLLKPAGPVIVRPLINLPDIVRGKRGAPLVSSQRLSYARYIAGKISEWHNRGLDYGSMAVLYETRTYARPLLSLLRESGIPYTQFKETGLFSSDEALAWAYLLDYCDERSPQNLKKLLLSDFFGEEPGTMANGRALEKYEAIAEAWQELAAAGKWPQLVHAVCADTALFSRALRRIDGKRVVAAYRQLGEWVATRLIADRQSPGETARRLRAFRSGARPPAEEEDRFRRETEEDAVRAATIHSSKGLQFDIVFLLGGGSRPPLSGAPFVVRTDLDRARKRETILVSLDQQHQPYMAEEDECEQRRILYVGCTRAKYKMVLPQWQDFVIDKTNGTGSSTGMSSYDQNLAAACAAHPDLFAIDLSSAAVAERPSASLSQIYRRPRADAFTMTDTVALAAVEQELVREALPLRISGRRRLLHSYSSLVHEERGSDHQWQDEMHETSRDVSGNLPEQFRLGPASVLHVWQKGAPENRLELAGRETGSALHEILEELGGSDGGFLSVNDRAGDLMGSIERRLGAYGLLDRVPEKRAAICGQVRDLIKVALALPLPLESGVFRLSELQKQDRIAEPFFAAAVDRKQGAFAVENGIDRVVGFIDLVFRRGKEIYLLDWKSDSLDSYDKETVLEAMHRSGYTVQAALYAAAYDRWLSTRFTGAGFALKGICYLFLRGPAAVTIPVNGRILSAWNQGLEAYFKEAGQARGSGA
jgi:exodeoxyribonuclease V beta subunit